MLSVALRQEFGGLKVFFLNDIHKWLELSVNQSKVESNFSHHSRWWVLKRHYGLGWHVLKYQAKLFTDQKIAGSELTIHEESGKAVITPFLLVLGCFLYLHQSLPFKILSGIFPLSSLPFCLHLSLETTVCFSRNSHNCRRQTTLLISLCIASVLPPGCSSLSVKRESRFSGWGLHALKRYRPRPTFFVLDDPSHHLENSLSPSQIPDLRSLVPWMELWWFTFSVPFITVFWHIIKNTHLAVPIKPESRDLT